VLQVYRYWYILRFYEGVGVGVLKIEESESELLCSDSTALISTHCSLFVSISLSWRILFYLQSKEFNLVNRTLQQCGLCLYYKYCYLYSASSFCLSFNSSVFSLDTVTGRRQLNGSFQFSVLIYIVFHLGIYVVICVCARVCVLPVSFKSVISRSTRLRCEITKMGW
jgi:hypothetical protein